MIFVLGSLCPPSGLWHPRSRRSHARETLKIRVVDGEVGVVLLQDPDGRPLDGQLADAVAAGLSVRGANDFDVVSIEKRRKRGQSMKYNNFLKPKPTVQFFFRMI